MPTITSRKMSAPFLNSGDYQPKLKHAAEKRRPICSRSTAKAQRSPDVKTYQGALMNAIFLNVRIAEEQIGRATLTVLPKSRIFLKTVWRC